MNERMPAGILRPAACASAISVATGPIVVGGRQILSPLQLTLNEQRIGIIGRNGAGKTTFMRLLAGLIAPRSGEVRLGPVNPQNDRRGALDRIGILFQNPDHQILFPTIDEELAFGLGQKGLPRDEAFRLAKQALAAEGRAHWAGQPVSTLSGGQKHYLCLLSLLLMAPETLLLDEPFAGLDLPTIARLRRRLTSLPQRLIIISHDPAAMEMVERILWFEQGRLVADGPADDVLPAYIIEMERIGESDADTDLAD